MFCMRKDLLGRSSLIVLLKKLSINEIFINSHFMN